MTNILSSASKIAFLALIFTACGAFLTGRLEAKEFMILASSASAFYFANKGDASNQYLGK
jgi:hypothetical protein